MAIIRIILIRATNTTINKKNIYYFDDYSNSKKQNNNHSDNIIVQKAFNNQVILKIFSTVDTDFIKLLKLPKRKFVRNNDVKLKERI